MAEIRAFRAYRYNLQRVAPADVLTQPYDKITAGDAGALLRREPVQSHSHRERPRARGRFGSEQCLHARRGEAARMDRRQEYLVRDATPAIYAYSQEYTVPGTNTQRTRRGFIGLGRVEDFEARRRLSPRAHAFGARRPIAWNCCARPTYRPACCSCSTTTPRSRSIECWT